MIGFIIQGVDTTKHRTIENEIRENEQRLKFLLKRSHIGYWELDLVDETSHRSLIHDQIFGYEHLLPEWTYEMFINHVKLEDRDRVKALHQHAIANKQDWNFECRIVRKDGEVRWILASGGHKFDINGNIRLMTGIVQDITELKQAELYKIRHAAEIESLFEALPDIYFRMKFDGTIIDFHAQHQKELYMKPEDFLGKRMQDILPKSVSEQFQSKIAEIAQSDHTLSYSYELEVNNELLHFDASLNRIKINNQLICVIRNVTEAFKAKDSLEISEQRFRTIFEQAAIGVALVNYSSGEFIRINQRFCDMFGYSIEEMLNSKTIKDITHPDDLNKSFEYLNKLSKGIKHDVCLEKRCFHQKGHIVWIELTVSANQIMEENLKNVIVVVQDITKRKQTDEKIKVKQKQLLQAESIGRMGSWEVDLTTLQGRWSPEIFNILKAKKIDQTGVVLTKYNVHTEDWQKVESSLNETIQLGSICEIECRILLSDERVRWVYCKAERQDGSGSNPKLVGILQDITNRKKEEEKQRLAAAVYKNTSEGVMITNNKGIIIDVNQAFSRLTGYEYGEIIGQSPQILKSGKQDKDFYKNMWKKLSETGQWTGEIWNRRKNGSIYPELLNISSICDNEGNLTHYIGVFSDISNIKSSEQELYRLAHHDALTELPNRLLLNVYIDNAVKRAKRHNSSIAIIFFDLDNFKIINDSFGHTIGDLLLQETAKRLLNTVRECDSVSRISGDEFIILLEDIYSSADAEIAVTHLMDAFQKSFSLQEFTVNITASMGICLYPQDTRDTTELLRNADTAMYEAKDVGRNSFKFYSHEMTKNAIERVSLENNLRQAIKNKEFFLNYQPQIDLRSNSIIGLEVLIRWNHPQQGLISPANFIPLAEETGLINEIGEWVLRTACQQAKDWLNRGVDFGRIAINIAGPQIKRGNIVNLVKTILAETQLPANYLELEVTESYIMQQTDKAIEQMGQIMHLGAVVSIDDFGTGYSSLTYLKKLPINKLKIDQSFVHDIPFDQDDMAISKAVIAMGTALGLKVIAEGVETKEQENFLNGAGCHEVQGYLYSKPIDKIAIEEFLINFKSNNI